MAIYDNNGTTLSEIGAVYDNDGTVDHGIGSVYDTDGTVGHLIFSPGESLYDYGMVVPFTGTTYVSNSNASYTTRTDNGTNLYAKAQYNVATDVSVDTHATWMTDDYFDISGYSTAHVKAKIRLLWSSYNLVALVLKPASGNEISINILANSPGTFDDEWDIDLSSYSGSYRIGVRAKIDYSNARGAEVWLYQLMLS